jgi:hypothetical protein
LIWFSPSGYFDCRSFLWADLRARAQS